MKLLISQCMSYVLMDDRVNPNPNPKLNPNPNPNLNLNPNTNPNPNPNPKPNPNSTSLLSPLFVYLLGIVVVYPAAYVFTSFSQSPFTKSLFGCLRLSQ